MNSNYLQNSHCGCHKLLLLGDADAQIDDDSTYHAIETHANISRYLSFEQATVGMMAMRLLCMPYKSAQSVFPHDCAYLRETLFADIHKDHPIYWGLTGAKRALEHCNGSEISSEQQVVTGEQSLLAEPRESYSPPKSSERQSVISRSTRTKQQTIPKPSYSTPQVIRRVEQASAGPRRQSMPNTKFENYSPSELAALILDYENPVKVDKGVYYPGNPSWANGLPTAVMEDASYLRIERIESTTYRRLDPKRPRCNIKLLAIRCEFTNLRKGQEGNTMITQMPLAKFIYCENAVPLLVAYIKRRAIKTNGKLSTDNLFRRYPTLIKVLPSDICLRPRSKNRRRHSPTDTSETSDSHDDDYYSDSQTTSESYVTSDSEEK